MSLRDLMQEQTIESLQKRIAELEKACRLALTALYYDPDFVDGGQVTRKAIDAIESVISEGGEEQNAYTC